MTSSKRDHQLTISDTRCAGRQDQAAISTPSNWSDWLAALTQRLRELGVANRLTLRFRGLAQGLVQTQLGHKRPGVTETYTAFDPDYLENAADALEELLRAAPL